VEVDCSAVGARTNGEYVVNRTANHLLLIDANTGRTFKAVDGENAQRQPQLRRKCKQRRCPLSDDFVGYSPPFLTIAGHSKSLVLLNTMYLSKFTEELGFKKLSKFGDITYSTALISGQDRQVLLKLEQLRFA